MSKRIDLLRLDYVFSVVVPMLIAIYLNRLNPFEHFDIILGFILLAITGNTWNDVIDMKDPNEKETLERVEGYHPREIFTIGLASFILGITLLLRTCFEHPINGLFLIIIIVMVLLYCVWFKSYPIINHILLGASHIILPYFIIKFDANLIKPGEFWLTPVELTLMLTFFAFAFTGQIVHETIDGDSITKYLNLKQIQVLIWISSIITIIMAIWAFVIIPNYYFIPFMLFPLGTMFTFRRPTQSTKGVKDVGILIGNFLLLYFMCLIILQMAGVI
ncbi:MAG: UbiA family prenyltransferase [Promethearchaeota archaeon]